MNIGRRLCHSKPARLSSYGPGGRCVKSRYLTQLSWRRAEWEMGIAEVQFPVSWSKPSNRHSR